MVEPATFGLLAQCSTNSTARSICRFECMNEVNLPSSICLMNRGRVVLNIQSWGEGLNCPIEKRYIYHVTMSFFTVFHLLEWFFDWAVNSAIFTGEYGWIPRSRVTRHAWKLRAYNTNAKMAGDFVFFRYIIYHLYTLHSGVGWNIPLRDNIITSPNPTCGAIGYIHNMILWHFTRCG